jgi:L-lactate dehydrogenase
MGSGTSLDTARFRRRLGERYSVSPDNVHAYIIGEHGDSQIPVLSSVANDTRTAGLQIQQAKGATYYGIATKQAVLTVSSLAPESMNLREVCLSLPAIIHRAGVARVLSIPLPRRARAS